MTIGEFFFKCSITACFYLARRIFQKIFLTVKHTRLWWQIIELFNDESWLISALSFELRFIFQNFERGHDRVSLVIWWFQRDLFQFTDFKQTIVIAYLTLNLGLLLLIDFKVSVDLFHQLMSIDHVLEFKFQYFCRFEQLVVFVSLVYCPVCVLLHSYVITSGFTFHFFFKRYVLHFNQSVSQT
jgi:hypothetical protein